MLLEPLSLDTRGYSETHESMNILNRTGHLAQQWHLHKIDGRLTEFLPKSGPTLVPKVSFFSVRLICIMRKGDASGNLKLLSLLHLFPLISATCAWIVLSISVQFRAGPCGSHTLHSLFVPALCVPVRSTVLFDPGTSSANPISRVLRERPVMVSVGPPVPSPELGGQFFTSIIVRGFVTMYGIVLCWSNNYPP